VPLDLGSCITLVRVALRRTYDTLFSLHDDMRDRYLNGTCTLNRSMGKGDKGAVHTGTADLE